MQVFEVGQMFSGGKGHAEGTIFDLSDAGAMLVVYFDEPRRDEIEQFSQEKPFEIRYAVLNGIIMFTVKFGNLNWMDMPYTPHLSPDLTKLTIPSEGEGLALTVVLVNSRDGIIKHIRLLGLSTNFTRKLFGEIMEQKASPFDKDVYYKNLKSIFNKYQTKEIVKLSRTYCKI